MPRIGKLTGDVQTVSIPIGDETLEVVFSPSRITPRMLTLCEGMMRSGVVDWEVCRPLAGLFVSWTLETDDGEPYPITPDAMMDMPIVVLTAILQAVTEHFPTKPASPLVAPTPITPINGALGHAVAI